MGWVTGFEPALRIGESTFEQFSWGWMTGDAPASSRSTGGRSTGELHPP